MTIARNLKVTLLVGSTLVVAGVVFLLILQWREKQRIDEIMAYGLPASAAAFELEGAADRAILDAVFDHSAAIPGSGIHKSLTLGTARTSLAGLKAHFVSTGQSEKIAELDREIHQLDDLVSALSEAMRADPHYLAASTGRDHLGRILSVRTRIDDLLRDQMQHSVIRDLQTFSHQLTFEGRWSAIALVFLMLIIPLILWRVSTLIEQRILLPLTDIESAMATYATGDRSIRIRSQRDDEIGSIGRKINATLDIIQTQSVTKLRLREIVNALSTFVVVVNGGGRISFTNERFQELMFRQNVDPASLFALDLLPEELRPVIGRTMASGELPVELTTTLMMGDRALLPVRLVIAAIHSHGDDRFLFVAQDMSEWSAMQSRLTLSELERHQIMTALSLSEARARELEWATLDVAEREQRRIGRELHDGLGQRLTGISFLAKVLGQRTEALAPDLTESTEWIVSLLNHAINDVRKVSRELNPVGFEETDFATALQMLAADVRKTWGVACEVVDQADAATLRGRTALNLYRIIQEATTNALKHGRAQTITILLEARRNGIRLAVIDDGAGFDTHHMHGGSGLSNIRTRVKAMNGRVHIRSGRDGTILIVWFPSIWGNK